MTKSLHQGLRLLERLGRKALQPYMKQDHRGRFRYYSPAINRSLASILRNFYLTHGKEWPYEDVYPGLKHDLPPKPRQGWEKARVLREQRLEKIKANMNDMDRKIAEYRESLKIKDVSLLDQLTMTKKQIRMKYTRSQQKN